MSPQEIVAEILEHLRGMWRYRWFAARVAWLIAAMGVVAVYLMPDVYRGSARVFVDTNSLLRPLMEGLTAQQNPLSEVQLVSTAVLSRPNLERVAYDTDLALRARTPEQMEMLITNLQDRIQVSGNSDNIFRIQYEDTSREMATRVVSAVLDAFVESSLGNQGEDAEMTERALAGEIQQHEERLHAAETKLAQFKSENVGFMPGEAGDYYQQLQAALEAVSSTEEQIRLVTERRDELQRQIGGEEPVFGIMPGAGGAGSGSAAGCSQAAQISEIEAELSNLRLQFTDRHPRILALQDMIANLQERCDAEREAARAAGVRTTPQTASSEPLEVNPVYQNLRIQLSTAEVELAELRASLTEHRNRVAELRRDVDRIAEVEAELKQLNRDYDVIQRRHQQLLARWEDLQAKKRLDPVTDQVQFQRIDPPFAPMDPIGPNRPLMLAAVAFVALGAGVAGAFLRNQIRPAFFSRRSLGRAVDLPVLGSVSLVLGPRERTRRRADAAAWVGAFALLLVTVGMAIMFASPGSALLRGLVDGVGAWAG